MNIFPLFFLSQSSPQLLSYDFVRAFEIFFMNSDLPLYKHFLEMQINSSDDKWYEGHGGDLGLTFE